MAAGPALLLELHGSAGDPGQDYRGQAFGGHPRDSVRDGLQAGVRPMCDRSAAGVEAEGSWRGPAEAAA